VKEENLSEPAETARFYFSWIRYLIALIVILACLYFFGPNSQIIAAILITGGILFLFLAVPFSLLQYIWVSVETSSYLKQAKKAGIATHEQKRIWNLTLIFLAITHALGMVLAILLIIVFSNVKLPEGVELLALILLAGILMIPAQCVSMAYLAKLEVKKVEASV
jgi:hypothetical protein